MAPSSAVYESSAVAATALHGASTIHSNIIARYDISAGALSVDASGSYAVLAGRKGLHLVDLEAPYVPMATLHHQTKWDVTVVKCNPHMLYKSYVASTSNHNTLIWNIANASTGSTTNSNAQIPSSANQNQQSLVATLRAHTRPVSDLSWSPAQPAVLATCSADLKTHLWDIRAPQRPVQTLGAVTTGATKVEWNRVDQTSLATAHDGEVRVWDTRAADKAPAALITAHMQKIYGIDWHPRRMYELVTCSEDKTVKIWDVTQPRVYQGLLTTGAPVWRARYTPFGDGLVTISQRLDNTLRLWALSQAEGTGISIDPVYTYAGHSDLVKGVSWRARPNAGTYQLVSWSKNQELRMWRVEPQHLEACGYDTTSYTDAVSSEPAELMRVDVAQLQTQSKYDISILKSDFVPLAIPTSAVPLSASEYSLEGKNKSLQALLTFEEDLIKDGDVQTQSDDESGSSTGAISEGVEAKEKNAATVPGKASALPCPRISGACFSGPNMLLVFDSRVAIGQTRSSSVPAAMAAGKTNKTPQPANKLPRTYDELLDLRDSRFATKKNKKPSVKLRSASNVLGAMDLASEWGQQHDMMESIGFGDDADVSTHGYRNNNYFTSTTDPMLGGDMDTSIHGGSEYLTSFFSTSDYHLQVNPEHRISVPTNPNPGVLLSPRASTIRTTNAGDRSKRVEQSAPPLNLDLSLSVTILDLSKLCGVSSILTYQTNLTPQVPRDQKQEPMSRFPKAAMNQVPRGLGSGSRSLLTWMLRAADEMTNKATHSTISLEASTGDGTTSGRRNHLSHILKSLLSAQHGTDTFDPVLSVPEDADSTVSDACAYNSRVAALAGRTDLQQIWSLLEISTAPVAELPLYTNNALANILTSHPWSAHPFGKRLVRKVLDMYEQAGDLPTLATIVCVLSPADSSNANSAEVKKSDLSIQQLDQTFAKNGSTVTSTSSVETALSTTTTNNSEMLRSRKSTNALSQLSEAFADVGDLPPIMKNARRSVSHNEFARVKHLERTATVKDLSSTIGPLQLSKEWPAPSIANRVLSPTRTATPKALTSSGWKMDFEKLDPFKTWSASTMKDSSPRPTIQDALQPAVNPALMMSPKIEPQEDLLLTDRELAYLSSDDVEAEDLHPSHRIALEVDYRSFDDDKCLLSSNFSDEERYDIYKKSYAELLYQYGAMNLRNSVLKTVSKGDQEHEGIVFGLLCQSCQTPTDHPYCSSCRDFAVKCSVCQLVVRGQSMFCMACGHGGHAEHLREWFESEAACPTGCGCWCKQATGTLSSFHVERVEEESVVPSRSYSF